ncbi:Sap190p [Sugiyamaella lignohabitans]|uniref:Sap190p n=1 Tax=Sugiyamaella lignohabitans TaxID=796027 RepID=A0A167F2P7_9ASCO|nr:Sap190p [Sugiyamaella lignohabitans]ANB14749.1 Sap190p [Sugiyamaella lignohabitans]
MAFWRIGNGFSSVSPIDKILDKNDHTLVDLLNEPDLLQELLAPNTKLIEYLRQPDVMAEMIRYIADMNDKLEDEGDSGGGSSTTGASGKATTADSNVSAGGDSGARAGAKHGLDDKPLPSTPVSSEMTDVDDDDNGELDLHTGSADVDMAESGSLSTETEYDSTNTTSSTTKAAKRSRESDSDSSSDKDEDDNNNESSTSNQDTGSASASSASAPKTGVSNKVKHGLLNRTGYTDDDEDEEDEDDEDDNNSNQSGNEAYDSSFDDIQETKQRHAQVCSEILSADVWSLTEALMECTDLIEEIWKILDYPTPLDISYASYFTKISEHLLDKKTDEMLAFIRSQKSFVKRFMKHIDNPPLMDFLLKVISSDKSDNSTGIIDVSVSPDASGGWGCAPDPPAPLAALESVRLRSQQLLRSRSHGVWGAAPADGGTLAPRREY